MVRQGPVIGETLLKFIKQERKHDKIFIIKILPYQMK